MKMFTVCSHAVGFDGSLPYAGPVCSSKDKAVDSFFDMAIANDESESEHKRAAAEMKAADIETLVSIYDGDEVMCVYPVDVLN